MSQSVCSYDSRRRRPPSSSKTPHYMLSTTASDASVTSRTSAGSTSSYSRASRIPSPRYTGSTVSASSRFSSTTTPKRSAGGTSRRARGGGFGVEQSIGGAAAGQDTTPVDDGPVLDFLQTVSKLGADEWRARTMAFERLLSSLPSPDSSENEDNFKTPWYKSPPTVRRLATTITTLLLDPRSTVVKHTCNSLTILLTSPAITENNAGRYLMKDLLPTILALHGQTVNVIKSYALQMMLDILHHTKFKSGLPILLDKLRKDKSRDVREACARYLRAVLVHWGPGSTTSSHHYLSRDVYVHIGNGLARGLMDPSQCVRAECRSGFDALRDIHRDIWEDIVHKEDGPLSKDLRLKKTLINSAIRADAERSLASTEGLKEDDGSVYSQNSAGSQLSYVSRDSQISYGSRSYASRSTVANRSVATAPTVMGNRSSNRYGRSGAGGTTTQPTRNKYGGTTASTAGSVSKRLGATRRLSAGKSTIESSRTPSLASKRKSGIVPPSTSTPSPQQAKRVSPRRAQPQSQQTPTSNNPFAGAMASPPSPIERKSVTGSKSPLRPPLLTSPPPVLPAATSATTPSSDNVPSPPPAPPVNEEIANRAAISIQAAVRGAHTRQSILPSAENENETEAKVENAPKLGKTAKEMAHRRKTIGASKSGMVVPTGVDSPASYYGGGSMTSPSPCKAGGSGMLSPQANGMATPQDVKGSAGAYTTPPPTTRDTSSGSALTLSSSSNGPESGTAAASLQPPQQRRLSSIHLQRRLSRMSSKSSLNASGLSADAAAATVSDSANSSSPQAQQQTPETINEEPVNTSPLSDQHIKIGHQILLAHRTHIDELMETLRREMDSVGRFEILLASAQQQQQQNVNGDVMSSPQQQQQQPGLTEEDVLEYFEAVATCLEQRTENGKRLQEMLDKISRGDDDDDAFLGRQNGKLDEVEEEEELLVDEI